MYTKLPITYLKNNFTPIRHPEFNSGSRNYDLDSPPKADRHLLAGMTERRTGMTGGPLDWNDRIVFFGQTLITR